MSNTVRSLSSAAVMLAAIACLILLAVFWRSSAAPAFVSESGPSALSSENKPETSALIFTPDGYIFTEDVTLHITSPLPCDIYYTLDGTEPGLSSEKYDADKGITLEGKRSVAGYSVSAKAVYGDGSWSETFVHSYFLGKLADSRFNTMIFSLTSDPYNLFDYKHGILIAGKRRDDYIATHPSEKIIPTSPANWNFPGMDGERDIYVEILDSKGNKILSQSAGVRVQGCWSRAQTQKSLRLIARDIYGDNRFNCVLFTDKRNDAADGTVITSFKRLTLRNNANDSSNACLRDEVIQVLAGDAGFPDTQAALPASVYLNGKYYGFMWLKETYDDEYFEKHYGDYTGNFVILEGGDNAKTGDGSAQETKALIDYNKMYAYSSLDLTQDNIFEKLSEKLDVENYLQYCAIQTYIGNTDWPQNNHKAYRYYTAADEYTGTGVFDGKWRYLLYDTDFGLGGSGTKVDGQSTARIMDPYDKDKGYSPLFTALMKRADCRKYYIRTVYDLMNGTFSYEYANDIITQISVSRRNELDTHLSQSSFAVKTSISAIDENVKKVREFVKNRPDYFKKQLKALFNLTGGEYAVEVKTAGKGAVQINTYKTYENFSGVYPSECGLTVKAYPAVGEEFSYWLVNGETVYGDTIELEYSNAKSGKITVEPVLKSSAGNQQPVIWTISAKGGDDYFVLYNPWETAIRTTGCAVSDDPENLIKYVLPVVTLEPGQTMTVLCDNYAEPDALGKYKAGFNLKNGETLYLSYMKQVTDFVEIPKLSKGSLYQLDLKDGRFYEILKSGCK